MTTLKSFFEALNNEESKLIPLLASDNLGLIMRTAINELDFHYYNYSKIPAPREEQQEQFYIIQMGTARLIKLALESRESFDAPVVTTQRRADFSAKILSIVSAFGIIQHGRRVAQAIASGIGKIEETNPREFTITLPQEIEDEGFHERLLLEHYNRQSNDHFKKIFILDKFQEMESEVNKKLHELVYPFMEHYIGYDADPILDGYFFALASHEVSLQEGYDTYHYAVKFGGIRVQHYMLALKFIISHSIRHARFAEALVEKHRGIKLENVLTISADVAPFIECLRDAVNYFGVAYEDFEEISLTQAKQIFNILTYSRDNIDLIDAPGSPHPLSVRCSETGMIRAIFGAHSEPVRYLLESLRFHYPKDFDKNQASREASLQRATRRVLSEAFQGLDYLENVKIKLNGKTLSDIDLVVLDKKSGSILLIQLKHQELYGSELHSKSARNHRLKTQTKDWINAVGRWTSTLGLDGVKKALQLQKEWPHDTHIFRVIISRHSAYPLKEIVRDENSAFANWPQFYNGIQLVKRDHLSPTLNNLINTLQITQDNPDKVTFSPEPTIKWKLHELAFITTQETAGST